MSRTLLALSLFAMACDPSSSGDDDPACSVDQAGAMCVEYYGNDAEDSICAQPGTSSDACSEDGLIAVCTTATEGSDMDVVYYLYDTSYDAESAQAFCDLAGGELDAMAGGSARQFVAKGRMVGAVVVDD